MKVPLISFAFLGYIEEERYIYYQKIWLAIFCSNTVFREIIL